MTVDVRSDLDVQSEPDVVVALRVLGEPVRFDIVRRLAVEDLCTCHLVEELGLPQPLVSHHLRALRRSRLVTTERCGAFTYYRLAPGLLTVVADQLGALAAAEPGRRPC